MDSDNKLNNKQINIYVVLVAVYCTMLIVSNILSNRTFEFGQFMLPSAVIVFPLVYIINDILTECFGFKMASRTIFMAFCLNLLSVIFFNIAINLPTTIDYSSYNVVLENTLKPLFASAIAYLIGSLVNAKVMDVLSTHKSLMLRCVLSTLLGESLDAAIFISIMFIGVMDISVVITMMATQAIVKTVYEIIVYPVTRKVINTVKAL